MHNVKEFFNQSYREEQIELKRSFKLKKYIRIGNGYKKRKPVIPVTDSFDLSFSKINDLTSFMNCDIRPNNCPLFWNKLKDSSEKNKRFCTYCNKDIYLVNSEKELTKLEKEKRCIAISKNLFNNMSKDIKFYYVNLELRLTLLKLFLIHKEVNNSYNPIFSYYSKKPIPLIIQLKMVLLHIFFTKNTKETILLYEKYGVNMKYLFKVTVPKLNDREFTTFFSKVIQL